MVNQTRKYFGTDGIRGRVGDSPINAEFVLKLGWAVGKVFARDGGGKVLIGKDTRISGYMFESALEAGLSAAGVDIGLLGPLPTPAIAHLTKYSGARAGIVISASHNPYYDNGIKFFSDQGIKLADEIELAIEEQLNQPMVTVDSAQLGKAKRIVDAARVYMDFCKSTISPAINLKGLKIVVDCANGATYNIAPVILRELGANVIELSVKPNGLNINDHCGSTYPQTLQQTVLTEKANLGIAFDGDGDRVIMIDNQSEIVDGDELLYIIAKDYLKRGILKGGVVGTVMSNLGLESALHKLGLIFTRTKVGDRYVMEELTHRGWMLGGESSGHIIWLGATTTGDGIISALQVLSSLASNHCDLHELKKDVVKYPQSMINVRIQQGSDVLNQPKLKQAIQEAESQLAGKGRVLLRLSGTEPVLRVMVEGEDKSQVNIIAAALAQTVETVNGLGGA